MTHSNIVSSNKSAVRPDIQIIRHEQLCCKLNISSAKLFDMVAKGIFPKPFKLIPGGRAVGWLEHEIDQWILERKHADHGDRHE